MHQTFALVNQSRSHQPLYFLLYFLNQVAILLFEIVLFFFLLIEVLGGRSSQMCVFRVIIDCRHNLYDYLVKKITFDGINAINSS